MVSSQLYMDMGMKKCSGVLCDIKMPVKLNGKIYRRLIRCGVNKENTCKKKE